MCLSLCLSVVLCVSMRLCVTYNSGGQGATRDAHRRAGQPDSPDHRGRRRDERARDDERPKLDTCAASAAAVTLVQPRRIALTVACRAIDQSINEYIH